MKIAFVTSEYVTELSYSGGLANYLGRFSVELARQGHTVHVFTRSTEKDETISFQNVTVHRIVPLWDKRMILDHIDPLIPRSRYNFYQDLKAAWCLYQRWLLVNKSIYFDITQVSNVLAVGLFFRFSPKSSIVTRMSSYRPYWDEASGKTITSEIKLRWLMEKIAVKGVKHTYAPTQFVAQKVKEGYQLKKVDVIETPFFVEEEILDYSVFNEQVKNIEYIAFFGRMTQMKGVHIFAEALVQTLSKIKNMHVFFIGGQSGLAPNGLPMIDYIQTILDKYEDRVHFLDSMRHNKLYPFIMNARFIVLPSIIDNLPNTCLESMGLGKLVIATTGSCFEQIIENEVSGFLVEPNNSQELDDVICKVWNLKEDEVAQICMQAKKTIDRLKPEYAIPKILEYYSSLIS